MAVTITDILNQLNKQGFFSYVIPFLLIFAVVYAILEKTRLFKPKLERGAEGKVISEDNKAISVIIAAAIGLLSLQFDTVSIFFANIFPKFGVGLAIFLVLLIFLGFFYQSDDKGIWPGSMTWIGWVVGIGVALWAIANWGTWFGGGYDLGYWFHEYFWSLVIIGGLIGAIVAIKRN